MFLGLRTAQYHVKSSDLPAARDWYARVLGSGATRNGEIEDVGHNIKKVTVFDPFGNEFGVIENPHFTYVS
jgi:hypothetical protein